MLTIGIDVDEVCSRTVTELIRRYNEDYKDELTIEQIKEWDIHKFVVPVCGTKVYKYFAEPDFYRKVTPVFNALNFILRLRARGHKIYFITSGVFESKVEWLHQNAFLSQKFIDWHFASDVIVAHDKSMIRVDVMVDDKPENLIGHRGILFDRPWNHEHHSAERVFDWQGVYDKIMEMEAK